jgi:hypothetical protein
MYRSTEKSAARLWIVAFHNRISAYDMDGRRRPRSVAVENGDKEVGRGAGSLAESLLGQLRQLGNSRIDGMQTLCNKVPLALALNFVAALFGEP